MSRKAGKSASAEAVLRFTVQCNRNKLIATSGHSNVFFVKWK
jgi:hypothetical protein